MTYTIIMLEKLADLESRILNINGKDYKFFKNQYQDNLYGVDIREDRHKKPNLSDKKYIRIKIKGYQSIDLLWVKVKGKEHEKIRESKKKKGIYILDMRSNKNL
ncbi:MAG: hypothetical protein ISS23_00290 [Nanoarchaeota archaeon]|nr:hypothetical protein [Nanoarchaeota archaeon]